MLDTVKHLLAPSARSNVPPFVVMDVMAAAGAGLAPRLRRPPALGVDGADDRRHQPAVLHELLGVDEVGGGKQVRRGALFDLGAKRTRGIEAEGQRGVGMGPFVDHGGSRESRL